MLDPTTGTFHYVNAGHEPPVLIGPSGPCLWLRPTGPALGLTTEARNEECGFFDEERRLALLDAPAPSAALLDRIERAVHDYAAGAAPSDDVTLMAIRRGLR